MDDHTFDPKAAKLRRFEVITGTGRRRRWPTAVKARIVAESFAPGVQVSDVARRHDLRPQQLFGWRREAREGRLAMPGVEVPTFVPILTNLASGSAAARSVAEAESSSIEIELRGVVVRVRGRMATGALAEVLAAVTSVT
jgi:transposase